MGVSKRFSNILRGVSMTDFFIAIFRCCAILGAMETQPELFKPLVVDSNQTGCIHYGVAVGRW